MKSTYKVAIALAAGAAIGGVAIQGIHAQAKPPVYVVIDIGEVTDAEGLKANTDRPVASTPTAMQGGRYLTRTDKITALDGTPPKRMIIIAFDSPEKAQAWNNSADQKKVNEVRAKSTKSRSFIVEGM
jgi:uncharacterized protein (DUF1330 family)